MLSAAGSAAVLFDGIKESCTENAVTVQVVVVSKCFFGNTLLAILHLEIAKNLFAADSAEQLNSLLVSRLATSCKKSCGRP